MKRRAAHALRLAACLWGLGFLTAALPRPAAAQSAVPPEAPAYEDHYIAGGTLSPDISLSDYGTSDPQGLARSIRVDAVASVLQQEGANPAPTEHENGIILNTQWDTVSYGAWSADAAGRFGAAPVRNPDGTYGTSSFSVHERGMPFDGGWQTDNSLGDIYAPLIDLARAQPRILLGQGPMAGFDTEWRGPSGLQIVAGAGEPGIFDGIKVPTFDTLGGSTATLGAQWSPAPNVWVGGEYAGAHDVDVYYAPVNPALFPGQASSQRISSDTGIVTAAWQEDASTRMQLNLIDGTLDGYANALGAWFDATHTHAGVTQSFGVFRIDPNLAWGNQLITSDVQGGYYRVDYQGRRWLADFGVDEVKSVSGDTPTTTFLTGDARYQLSRDTGIGGVANLRYSDSNTAWSVQAYLDNANSWGTGRGQLDYATDPQTSDATFTLQQTWNMPTGARLSTSAALDRIETSAITGFAEDSTLVRVALYGGGDLTARLALDGTLQWATAVQGRAAPSTSADVTLSWQLGRNWSLLGSYYENRVGSWTQLVVTSPLTPPTLAPVPSTGERGVFLTLRYQQARGAHFVPLGGAPGSGSGRLTGIVYLDANENGRFDAGEPVAPNVTVILDGRFSTRTDTNGRYDFPAVAAGHHVLTVQADNLPLPWTLTNSGRTEVDVATRERTDIDIGAVRLK